MSRAVVGLMAGLAVLLALGGSVLADEPGAVADKSGSRVRNTRPRVGESYESNARYAHPYREVRGKYSNEIRQSRVEIKQLRLDVARALSKPNPDRQEVKRLLNKMVDLRRREQLLLTDQMFDTLKTMSPQQREEYLRPIIERFLR